VRSPFLALLLVVACGASGPELAGDRAYGAGRYADALAQYHRAAGRGDGGRLQAKLAAAALRSGELAVAADAWRRLAADDPTRVEEAADGLEAVAREADRRADTAALRSAVLALGAAAPERPVGRHVLAWTRHAALSEREAVSLLPAAMAAAPDGATVDSLLAAYAVALQASAGCEQAAPAYRAALRRTRSSVVRGIAGSGLATCALNLGLVALGNGQPADAERWLVQAVGVDSVSWTGRRALIALGDARVGQGDILAAAIAYQSAADAGVSDSLGRIARQRLTRLGNGGADSTGRRSE
jgi:tetratricopeptide (TPR) repeat protein